MRYLHVIPLAALLATTAKSDPSPTVRSTAISWLPKLQGDAGVSTLEEILRTEQDPQVQRTVVQTLMSSDNQKARSAMRGATMLVLVATNDAKTIEGEPVGGRVVVLRFPNEDSFRAWYDSPAYQDVIGMRLESTSGFVVLADGVDGSNT